MFSVYTNKAEVSSPALRLAPVYDVAFSLTASPILFLTYTYFVGERLTGIKLLFRSMCRESFFGFIHPPSFG